jgi:hypothetical protein
MLDYFSAEVRGLRGPGLTEQQEEDLAAALAPATTETPGQLSAADKQKLDGLGELASKDEIGAFDVGANAVNNAGLSDMPANTIKGRLTSDGDPQDLSVAQIRALAQVNNVDNTSDANKPISTAVAAALAAKATSAQGAKADTAVQPSALGDLASKDQIGPFDVGPNAVNNAGLSDMPADTIKGRMSSDGDPQDLSAAQIRALVDVDNVDNTSDADKPISTAVAAALSGKATSAQGAKADTAVQPGDLGDLATKDQIGPFDVSAGAVNNAGLSDMPGNTIKGRLTNDGDPQDLSVSQIRTLLQINNVDNTPDASKPVSGPQATAINAVASDLDAVSDSLDARLIPAEAAISSLSALIPRYPERAGDARALFSTALTGDPLARAIISAGVVEAVSGLGTVLRIRGQDTDDVSGYISIAPRIAAAIYPGRTYRVTYRLRRAVDPTDPANNAVELRWQNLNHNKASVSNVRLSDILTPTVADGDLTFSFLIGKAGAPGDLVYTIPPTAIYGLPELRIYGNGQETYVISIDAPEDVTDQIAGGADVTALADRVEAVEIALPNKADRSELPLDAQPLGLLPEVAGGAIDADGYLVPFMTDKPVVETQASADVGQAFQDDDGYLLEQVAVDGSTNTMQSPHVSFALQDADGYLVALMTDKPVIETEAFVDVGQAFQDVDGYLLELSGPDGTSGSLFLPGITTGTIDPDGYLVTPDAGGTVDDMTTYGSRDAANIAASSALKSRTIATDIAGLLWDYNLNLLYGQSLSVGVQSFPALSKTQTLSNKMLGGSTRSGVNPAGVDFSPVGGLSFQPLIATAQNPATRAMLTDAEVAALPDTSGTEGETYIEGACNGLKKLWNASRAYLDDLSRVLVGAVSGEGSKTVVELSNSGNYWRELTTHVLAMKTLGDSAFKSSGLIALNWAQGENDYALSTTESAWSASFLSGVYSPLLNWIGANYAQSVRPAVFFCGVSPNSRRDNNSGLGINSIDMAQINLARERDNFYVVGPNYHVPDRGIHLTSNGSRWVGNMLAKVQHRVLVERRPWRPLEPRWEAQGGPFRIAGNIVSIDFFVPEPPLAWFQPYVGRVATDYVGKGFTVRDGLGVIGFRVRLVLNSIVELTLVRAPVGLVWVSYAGEAAYAGHGCLRDSDPFISPDLYEYSAGSGQTADENIPALVGKPYPNFNPCVPFRGSIAV